MAIPSLAMIPSGYKDGKVYSVLPTNGDGDFTFSRGSNATRVNSSGLIETVTGDTPRLDYTDSSCPSLLLEPQSTNLIEYSEAFENYFNVSEITLDSNYAISPDGTLNANKISFPTTSDSMYRSGLSYSGTHTVSFWYKGEGSDIGKTFNVKLSSNFNITLESEWKRFEEQINGLSSIEITNRNNTTIGNGSLLLYGFQLEEQYYATSYIPTNGAVATRLADECVNTSAESVIGQTEGSIFAEFKCLDSVANLAIWMRNPSGGNYRDMIKLECGDSKFTFEVRESNVTSTTLLSDVLPTNVYYKVAVAYKQNDFVMYLNGVQISVDTSGNVPTCSEIYVGKYIDGGVRMGDVKSLYLYNTRLSNSELQELTQ